MPRLSLMSIVGLALLASCGPNEDTVVSNYEGGLPVETCDNGNDDDGDGAECSVHANWSGRFGTEKQDAALAMATGPNDTILIAGDFSGSFALGDATITTVNQTAPWPFAARLDSNGHVLTARYLEASGAATAVDGIDDDIFIGGHLFESGIVRKLFVRQLKPDMQNEWQYELGLSEYISLTGIVVDPVDRTIIAAGYIKGDVAFPGCNSSPAYTTATEDGFIMKLDTNTQSCAWAFTIKNLLVRAMTRKNNEILVAGFFPDNPVDLPGAPTPDDQGALIASFDVASQALVNVKYLLTDGPGRVDFNSLATDTSGNVYATGRFSGSVTVNGKTLVSDVGNGSHDGMVAAFDADLNPRWIDRFGGGGIESPRALVALNDTVYVSGTTFGGHPATSDPLPPWNCGSIELDCMFLLNLRATDGTTRWGRYFGIGMFFDQPKAQIAVGGNSDLWLSAGWSSEVNFGDKPLSNIGSVPNQDIVLAMFSPAP